MTADPDAEIRAGLALIDQLRFAEAEPHFRVALAARPGDPAAVAPLCAVLQLREAYAEALALAEPVLRADPRQGAVWVARGDALSGLGRPEAALDAYRMAVRMGYANAESLTKLAGALAGLGEVDAAHEALDGLLRLEPGLPEAHFRRGMLRLRQRDFAAGWDEYEARWASTRFRTESRGLVPEALIGELTLRPTPADLAGRRILLIGEQGIGDQVMYASMIPDLARIAAQVTCVCDPRLVRLFRESFPTIEVLAPEEARIDADSIDRVLAMGSLGGAFRRDPFDFPGQPYLTASDAARNAWAGRLGPKAKPWRVGVSWRGGAPTTRRQARSLSLDQLRPILDLPDCEFVSLQYGDVEAELAAFNAGRAAPVRHFPAADLEDFDDLAGLIAGLDLVVSVQTAAVHLAGAIGAEALVLLPRNPEWRYMDEGDTLPWYPQVRLFRQREAGQWDEAIGAVAADLVLRAL